MKFSKEKQGKRKRTKKPDMEVEYQNKSKKEEQLISYNLRDWVYIKVYAWDYVGKSKNLFLDCCSIPGNIKGVVLATYNFSWKVQN